MNIKSFIVTAAVFSAAVISCRDVPVGKLTDALDCSLWECSQWISAADAPVVTGPVDDLSKAADGASWFVCRVTNEKQLVSAVWMTSGLGVYDLYVNGRLVGAEVLKPGFTHPRKTKISYTYDVTEALDRGQGRENVFAAQVTPGWWADKIVTPTGSEGMAGKKCAFRSVLQLRYSDGSTCVTGTDTVNWKAGVLGPVKHAAIFDGESYDARELPGYDCPDRLGTPEINDEFHGEIFPTCGAEIYMREDLALAPKEAYVWKDVEGACEGEFGRVVKLRSWSDGDRMVLNPGETLVVDFGQNCAGVPSFVFRSEEGVRLTCLPSEILNDGNGAVSRGMDGPEGSCHRKNLRIGDNFMRLEYVFGPEKGFVEYRPRFTFFGYRLISLTATGKVEIRSIRSVPVTSVSASMETGTLLTGNESINRLVSNAVWGQRSNYLSVPTDCPQRNERVGWTADAQVFSATGSFFADTRAFFRKWMRDMRDTRSPRGSFPAVAPLAHCGGDPGADMMRVGWADAGIIVPWTVWKQFGDTEIVNENWDAMEKFIGYVNASKYDHSALTADNANFQWADWLSYEALESCSGRYLQDWPSTLEYWNYLGASYWIIDAGMMLDMARDTGRDTAKYERMVREAKSYVRETFLNDDGSFKNGVLNTMQTPALFALKNGIVEGSARQNMIERLKANFAEHDGCLQTGFLGTSILLNTLSDNGMEDLACDLLFQRKCPGWLYSVDNGATTIWERWNSYTIESGMGPQSMNSFNHYAYGCVCQWIWERAAGICADPAAPGFRHILMRPVPDRRMGKLKAELKVVSGVIRSEWEFEGDIWKWDFSIPEGSTASVKLPGESTYAEYGPGTYSLAVSLPQSR